MLMDKAKLNTGDHVALLYPPGLDLVTAFYGCLYAGKFKTNPVTAFYGSFCDCKFKTNSFIVFWGSFYEVKLKTNSVTAFL